MQEFISTFITGFEEIIREKLINDLNGVKILNVYNGLIHFKYNKDYNIIKHIPYLNNTFSVMSYLKNKKLTFNKMVGMVTKNKYKFLVSRGTCRIRFSNENKFMKVDKKIIQSAEEHILQCSSLKINRVTPSTEIWYIIRSEKIGFYCQLLFKRKFTEKKLKKGELRPELAYLMCGCAKLSRESIVCDPFCGYGSIPKQLLTMYNVKKVIASDINRELIFELDRAKWTNNRKLLLNISDARNLNKIDDNSIDAIISDPPWGYYEKIDDIEKFYASILYEMLRILRINGYIVVLVARTQEFLSACELSCINLTKQINILVNGKKASVFIIRKLT